MVWWCSFYSDAGDPRPLKYPPTEAVLGWWVTGESTQAGSEECYDILCVLVQADSETAVHEVAAENWPESLKTEWRFCNQQTADWTPAQLSNRFPPSEWMRERWAKRWPELE